MGHLNLYIRYDNNKLDSIGFSNENVCELIEGFSFYIEDINNEFNNEMKLYCHKTESLKLLHKLEGAMQYLALTGPIEFIQEIRILIKKTPEFNPKDSLLNLFIVTNKTLALLNKKYNV